MEHTNYAARLRYLAADQVDDAVVSFHGLDVVGPDNGKLGDLDGFIIDAEAGRVYYAVVDTAGWFRTKQLLLPIGHAALDPDGRSLRVDVNKDQLNRYPEFEESRFREFSDDDLRQFETRMADACCPDDVTTSASTPAAAYDTRRHYTQPSWWRSTDPARRDEAASSHRPVTSAAAGVMAPPVPERHDREHVVARGADGRADRDPDDVSPHYGGRAQPGDVLGIETGGERTHVGEDAEDENERRRKADERARKDKE